MENAVYVENAWSPGEKFDVEVHLQDETSNQMKLAFVHRGFLFTESSSEQLFLIRHPLSDRLNEFSETYAIVKIYRTGFSSNPNESNFDVFSMTRKFPLSKWIKPSKSNEGKKLLVSSEATRSETDNKGKKTQFLLPELNIKFVHDFNKYRKNMVPEILKEHIQVYKNVESVNYYYPIVFQDNFWVLNSNLIKLNKTNNEYSFTLKIGISSLNKFMLKNNFEMSMKTQASFMGEDVYTEFDNTKRILMETNPYLLGLTIVVTMLHIIFEILAFKNDIMFWKDKKDLRGLSIRTIFVEFFCSIIIFLYLYENDTSKMIIVSSFFSIFVELWKLTKAFKMSFSPESGFENIRNWIKIEPKISPSNEVNSTDEHDKVAVKYLCIVLLPLVIGYSIYSLFYEEHKGWYQWVLNSLVGSVYTFGFIMMCPQLYINYKLKSVAHLPWRMMTYKALNTVIDDLFAFIIKMPWLHRLSCFRDDVVFGIFLFQKWKYGVDYSRTNEFGYNPSDDNNIKDKNIESTRERSLESKKDE